LAGPSPVEGLMDMSPRSNGRFSIALLLLAVLAILVCERWTRDLSGTWPG